MKNKIRLLQLFTFRDKLTFQGKLKAVLGLHLCQVAMLGFILTFFGDQNVLLLFCDKIQANNAQMVSQLIGDTLKTKKSQLNLMKLSDKNPILSKLKKH